ncbi:MAG: MATE family efflux transporter [Bacteroides sp.]|nr:MATE family efflux transporter [Bacteroides sp.]
MSELRTPTALGTERIGKLLMQYALPAIIAQTAASLYNMVDSIFIGHGVGPMAISGLALTFPLMNLAAAFGAMVGVGASTLVSVKLGQKDYDTAQRVLGNVFVLNLILGLAFTVVVLAFLDPILYFFGGSDETVPYARDYMEVILLGNVVTHMYLGLNSVLRSAGHPKKAMLATIATVVVNTILDPIFIYGFDMGIRGAAVATVIAQGISLAWLLKLFSNKNELLHFHKGIFRLKRKIVFDSLSIGMAPFLMNMAACLLVILFNQGFKKYGGDLAIGAFGIVNRLEFVIVMVVMGFNQGMQPIAGFNYGARQFDRVNKVLKLTIFYATCVTTTGFLVGMFIPEVATGIFTSDQELISQASKGLRIAVMFFPIVGFQMVTSNFFQSIGMAGKAIFLSLSRQMLILMPCVLLLPTFWGVWGVWYSKPVSDLLASIIAAIMLTHQYRKFKQLHLANEAS